MKVSYTWLQRYFEKELPDPKEIGDLLTEHSFEVESIEAHGNDFVLDVKVLPDRAHDCLCHKGIAKEISVLTGLALKRETLHMQELKAPESNIVRVEVEDSALCRRFSALVIENVEVKESPAWLKELLESIGQRPINNIVDATNFVMFSVGQPLHAYDRALLKNENGGYKIIVRRARDGEKVVALGETEYVLNKENLVICDGNADSVLGIAAIRGGVATKITQHTKDIILESANFDGVNIRKTAKMLGVRTDASVRFENEITPELTTHALAVVSDLIFEIAKTDDMQVEGLFDFYETKVKPVKIEVSLLEIQKNLGIDIKEVDVEDIFNRSLFSFEKITSQSGQMLFHVTVPEERLDLQQSADIIEEVGRIYGYKNISPKEIAPFQGSVEIHKASYYADCIRSVLAEKGFSEVYTSTFMSDGVVELQNPLASDKGFLRRDLNIGLEKSLENNFVNADLLGLSQIKIFEIGKVFEKNGEYTSLGLAVKNQKGHKGNTEDIEISETAKLLSDILNVEIKFKKDGTTYHIDLDSVIEKLPTPIVPTEYKYDDSLFKYKKISTYPFVLRDIAVFVPEKVNSKDLLTTIEKEAGDLLVKARLFDEFKKENMVSYAYRLVFQSEVKTLTDSEVNIAMEKIVKKVTSKGWQVR